MGIEHPQLDAVAQTRELFQAMAIFGHQAVGATYGCEEGAPDPHSGWGPGERSCGRRAYRR